MVSVLFAALIGGFALGQAAPNLQHFSTAKVTGARVIGMIRRCARLQLPACTGRALAATSSPSHARCLVQAWRHADLKHRAGLLLMSQQQLPDKQNPSSGACMVLASNA